MKQERNKRKKAGFWVGVMFAAFLAAVTTFFVMIQMEKKLLSPYSQGEIYTTVKMLPKGLAISEENKEEYLKLTLIDQNCIPEGALYDLEQIKNRAAVFSIGPGVFLTKEMFEAIAPITSRMEAPVIAGFRAEDVSQVVGGVLRAGDKIHIYSVEEEKGAQLVWQRVSVQQVFDQAGMTIPNEDTTTSAQRINVYLDQKDVEAFYSRMEQGSLRVVKVWDK